MPDSWVDCATCGDRYAIFLSACPTCGSQKNSIVPEARKTNAIGKVTIGIVIALAVAASIMLVPYILGIVTTHREGSPAMTILQPREQEPQTFPREELTKYALDLINKDRAEFGLSAVKLSDNQAAQAHADDVFRTKKISHWMTNGEKPYMTYSRYGGQGSVQQNVAIAGFDSDQYADCQTNILLNCEKIEPLPTLQELEYEMMYKDARCCGDGHRDNILDARHTHVSIGITYDRYYLAFVENFENDYGLNIDATADQIRISGPLVKGELEQVNIYYDEMPSPEVYDENKQLLSYSAGKLIATVVKPLPPGYYYERPDRYTLIEATQWEKSGTEVIFDLAPAVKQDGVYTISAIAKDDDETFEVTSYSILVDSGVQ